QRRAKLSEGNASETAGAFSRLSEKLTSVLPGRKREPTLAGAKEAALVGEAQQVGRLCQRQVQPAEILLGELPTRAVQQLDEGGRFRFEPALQCALAPAKLAGNLIASRLAVGQPADDHFPRAVAGVSVIELLEIFAGEALVQLREQRVGGR